ncbi:MAG: tyrosine-type recombinase/integrase [Anaerolineaceae bacterium]|nr:tyrosine-type recombinase/integrase [Anaerolineaceae bacterium]
MLLFWILTNARWYWQPERGEVSNNSYVFLNGNKKPITPNSLYRMMLRLGKRSEIHLHPHQFRHTFAINFY